MKNLIFKTITLSLLLPALTIFLWSPVKTVSAGNAKDLQNSNSSTVAQNTANPIKKVKKIKKRRKHKKHQAKSNH